jgi:very-short-patch-repair endonuclease
MATRRTELARALRTHATDAERLLWRHISRSQLGVKFRRQFPLGPYILDFVSLEVRANIELDGGQHFGSEADIERDKFVTSQGFTVLRFWNNDVLTNVDGVLDSIRRVLSRRVSTAFASTHELTPPQPSPASGEGAVGN